MKKANIKKLQALLDEEVSGPLGDKIMNLVKDIVDDEKRDARDSGFSVGWDSALNAYMD